MGEDFLLEGYVEQRERSVFTGIVEEKGKVIRVERSGTRS